MTNVVDINKPVETKQKKQRFKRPSKAQYQKMAIMSAVSGVTAILKRDGDVAANGRTGENCISWWHKGDVMVWLEVCKHGNIAITIDCQFLRESVLHQLIGWCVVNDIPYEIF